MKPLLKEKNLKKNAAILQNQSKHAGLQRIYLCLGITAFILVFYLSYIEPKSTASSKFVISSISLSLDGIFKGESQNSEIKPPNIILILTDDQDTVLSGAEYMPNVKKLLVDQGTILSNAFVASPLCCPSRSTILTGRYVHNHGAINNSLTGHCSSQAWQDGPEKETVAVHLQGAGYRTFFAGKYLNQYGKPSSGGTKHVPPGWDWWLGLVGNSQYYNYSLSVNGTKRKHGDDPNQDYLTKVITKHALEFLDIQSSNENEEKMEHESRPFFMMLSTPACHAPFTPEPKYSGNFSTFQAPRTPNFNVKNDATKHWLLRLGEQPLSSSIVEKIDDIFRNRLRTLLTVDEMLQKVIEKLEEKDLMEDTYIIFTSDNGYHLGQFSLPLDKREPYEFDIRVPFVIRGPDVSRRLSIQSPTSNVDLAPTILNLANVDVPQYMDGVSLKSVLLQREMDKDVDDDEDEKAINKKSFDPRKRSMLVEHSGEGYPVQRGSCEYLGSGLYGCDPEFNCKCSDSWNNTYACVRQIRPSAASEVSSQHVQFLHGNKENDENGKLVSMSLKSKYKSKNKEKLEAASENDDTVFCKWEDNESFIEYYNLKTDPDQLRNLASQLSEAELQHYNNLLKNLRQCSGSSCAVI